MHDKFIVVDSETLETGSFNFTKSAEQHNAENVIVLRDPVAASDYKRQREKLWEKSE
jgi:phosphatidylserine/phosphatidylglycerophosphate/cardiolipin synthase-like enzyme